MKNLTKFACGALAGLIALATTAPGCTPNETDRYARELNLPEQVRATVRPLEYGANTKALLDELSYLPRENQISEEILVYLRNIAEDKKVNNEELSEFKDIDGDALANVDELKCGADLLNPDTDGDGLRDGSEVITYKTDPLKENPNVKYALDNNLSDYIEKIKAMDADGRQDENEKACLDLVLKISTLGISSEAKDKNIMYVLSAKLSSEGKIIMEAYDRLSAVSEEALKEVLELGLDDNVVDYLKVVSSLTDEHLCKYALENKLCFQDGKLTAVERDFLKNLDKCHTELLNYYLSEVESVNTQLANDLSKLPELQETGIEWIEALEDIVALSFSHDTEVRKGFELILNYGTPYSATFSYKVPTHNTQLEALLWLAADREIPESYSRVALAEALTYGSVITIGDDQVDKRVREYMGETFDFIMETDEIIGENASWQAKEYPLEACIALVYGAAGTMLPIPCDTSQVRSWQNVFRYKQMDVSDFEWSFVSLENLKEMRDFMLQYARKTIEEYIATGYKGNFIHPGREKSFDCLTIAGRQVLVKHNTNPNWQWEHFKEEGSFYGICVDRSLVEKTLARSINIPAINGFILASTDHLTTHTFALFYASGSNTWKAVSSEAQSTIAESTDYYYGYLHIPWDNLRTKDVWHTFCHNYPTSEFIKGFTVTIIMEHILYR